MKNSKHKKTSGKTNKRVLSQTVKEAILLFSFSISLYVYLTLTTYDRNDKSWINSSSGELQNLGGLFGSYLSETLYFIFGQASFLIPLLLIFAAFLIYHKQDTNDNNNLSRYFGFFIFLFSSCALLSIHFANNNLEAGSGGFIGDLSGSLLIKNLGLVGSTILLVFIFLISLSLWLKLQWIKIFELVGGYIIIFSLNSIKFLRSIPLKVFSNKEVHTEKRDLEFKRKLEKLKK